jgi:hypothetical protein
MFRRIVQATFPDGADAILAAHQPGVPRETARVWAFLHRVDAELFPVLEVEEYEQVVYAIPFLRDGWSYDRLHELDMSVGRLLFLVLCAQPVAGGLDSRIPLLEAVAAHVPHALVADLPDGGLDPGELHERLDGTPYAAAAEFADWLWGDTGTVFLDYDDEIEIVDADWTPEVVAELAAQWRRASALLDGVDALAAWLEADPPARFARLLDAALGRDPHLDYARERRWYACEITATGLVPVRHDLDPDPEEGAGSVSVRLGAPDHGGA